MKKDALNPRDIGLKSNSFHTADTTELTRRVIMNVEAMQKCGKTDFGLRGCPDPIVVFNFDQGLEGVIEKFSSKKTIIVAGIPKKGQKYPSYAFARPVPQGAAGKGAGRYRNDEYLKRVKDLAYPIWEKFIEDMHEFYQSGARTGIIDTGGAAFALGKFGYMGMDKTTSKDDPYGQKSGNLKSIFQGLITEAYSYDKNVLWLHRLKEKWVGGEPSGEFEVDGYKQLPFEVEISVRLTKKSVSERVDGKLKKREERFASISDCRRDPSMNGEKFSGKEVSFSYIMASVYGTEEEEWL